MFEQSIDMNDHFWLSWFNLGTIGLIEGKIDEAMRCLEKAKMINPEIWAVHENLGVAYSKKKLFQKANRCRSRLTAMATT